MNTVDLYVWTHSSVLRCLVAAYIKINNNSAPEKCTNHVTFQCFCFSLTPRLLPGSVYPPVFVRSILGRWKRKSVRDSHYRTSKAKASHLPRPASSQCRRRVSPGPELFSSLFTSSFVSVLSGEGSLP